MYPQLKNIFYRKSKLFAIIPLLMMSTQCQVNNLEKKTEKDSIDYHFRVSMSDTNYYILLTNNGHNNAEFFFQFNHCFFRSTNQLTEYIADGFSSAYSKDYLKAWDFVSLNIINNLPYTSYNWQHNPMILLNSLGYGYCDDKAWLLKYIWETMGYQSRTYCIGGHVVPEIFLDGKYRVFDPDFHSAYIDAHNEICGVKDLEQTPSLVNHPIKRIIIHPNNKSCLMAYSDMLYNYYRTAEDNSIVEDTGLYRFKYNSEMTLPPGGKLLIPVNTENRIHLYNEGILIIPKHFCGLVYLPFIIHKITGNGIIKTKRERHKIIGSREFIFKNNPEQEYKIEVENSFSELYVYFFINPEFLIASDSIFFSLYKNVNDLISVQLKHDDSIMFNSYPFFCYYKIKDTDCNCIKKIKNKIDQIISNETLVSDSIFEIVNRNFVCDTSMFHFSWKNANKALKRLYNQCTPKEKASIDKLLIKYPLIFYNELRFDTIAPVEKLKEYLLGLKIQRIPK